MRQKRSGQNQRPGGPTLQPPIPISNFFGPLRSLREPGNQMTVLSKMAPTPSPKTTLLHSPPVTRRSAAGAATRGGQLKALLDLPTRTPTVQDKVPAVERHCTGAPTGRGRPQPATCAGLEGDASRLPSRSGPQRTSSRSSLSDHHEGWMDHSSRSPRGEPQQPETGPPADTRNPTPESLRRPSLLPGLGDELRGQRLGSSMAAEDEVGPEGESVPTSSPYCSPPRPPGPPEEAAASPSQSIPSILRSPRDSLCSQLSRSDADEGEALRPATLTDGPYPSGSAPGTAWNLAGPKLAHNHAPGTPGHHEVHSGTTVGLPPTGPPAVHPQLQHCLAPLQNLGDPLSSTLPPPAQAVALLKGHPELQALLALLPTKNDLSALALDLKHAWRQDLHPVQQDVSDLQERVAALETFQATALDTIRGLQSSLSTQSSTQLAMADHLDDVENRSRRNNVRIRGLPEATRNQELFPTVTGIFNLLLGRPPDTHIELDRVHRALRAPSTDPTRPRDVICRVHEYALKEQIMTKVRQRGDVDFDGATLQLYPDLSRRTLRQRAILRPLLRELQNRNLPYRWGFPFALHVTAGEVSASLREPGDLPLFLSSLGLPPLTLPDWVHFLRDPYAVPPVSRPSLRPPARRPNPGWPQPQRQRRSRRSSLGPTPED
ncbi:transmembrane protein 260 isoform X4 [Hyla sarda]|uniref:transmembrane protein 260 isoform X4 n=1 Tax=Hyla sarda TaxID=327740 RepID=UPI0024C34C11|nr:transmembrane protein 260 isoform X4 [Hyla sarda]